MRLSDFSNVPWICAKRWKEKASKVILENAVFFECLFKALRLCVDLLPCFCRHVKSSPCIYV